MFTLHMSPLWAQAALHSLHRHNTHLSVLFLLLAIGESAANKQNAYCLPLSLTHSLWFLEIVHDESRKSFWRYCQIAWCLNYLEVALFIEFRRVFFIPAHVTNRYLNLIRGSLFSLVLSAIYHPFLFLHLHLCSSLYFDSLVSLVSVHWCPSLLQLPA